MSIPADPFDDMLATITTVMQSPTRPVAFVLSGAALRAVRAQCVAVHDGELWQLCGVRVLTMDSQTEPVRAFFSNAELAEYLRT